MQTVYEFIVPDLDGKDVSLEQYRSQVLLIVNTASKGSNKKSLKRLNRIQMLFKDRPFHVLGFPCNQFMQQEKKTNEKIRQKYMVEELCTFDVFSKIKVVGNDAHPLFRWLRKKTKDEKIMWNFNKFLVECDGKTVKKYDSMSSWSKMIWDIDTSVSKCENELKAGLMEHTKVISPGRNLLDEFSDE